MFRSFWSSWRPPKPTRRSFAIVWLSALLLGLWLHPAPLVQHLGKADPVVSAGLALAYGSPAGGLEQAPGLVELRIGRTRVLHELDARFVSVAVDSSQAFGGRFWSAAGRVEIGRGSERVPRFDFSRPRLAELARPLAPAYLRIGGTEADHVYYALGAPAPRELPPGYELVLDAGAWDELNRFTRAAGFDLMFTINAGPGTRTPDGAWQPDNAERLLAYAAERGTPANVWELGNEVNAYWFIHGPKHQPDGTQYARDLAAFRALNERYSKASLLAGPASAFFPVVGEPALWATGTLADMLAAGGGLLDIVSWHYYPQQSRRCPVATRRAEPGVLLEPSHLNEIDHWAERVERLRERWSPRAQVWLGETGNAQCGGEPALSDRFEAGFWWLDQLGRLAARGQRVVVRQTLAGSDYGLLDSETLQPRPDYYNTLLWKRLMGARVLEVTRGVGNPYLRVYAHCAPAAASSDANRGPGVTLLAINVHPSLPAELALEGAPERATAYTLSAPSLASAELYLNGQLLSSAEGLPALEGKDIPLPGGRLRLEPATYTFLELALDAPACDVPWPRTSDVIPAARAPYAG